MRRTSVSVAEFLSGQMSGSKQLTESVETVGAEQIISQLIAAS